MGKFSSLIRSAGGKRRFVSAVILAAGSGTRFSDDRAKQFTEIAGETVLTRSVRAFQECEWIQEIVVVTRKADIEGCRSILKEQGLDKVTRITAGGDTRQESAKLGFEAVNPACDYVAIHDAARCLVTPDMIEAALDSAFRTGAAACGTRSVDTVKKTNGADTVLETLERENIWLVQTPQVFMANLYRAAAYTAEKEGFLGTDDCSLCEHVGFHVQMVECGRTNIKITYPEDVVIAEAILASRAKRAETE